MAEDEGPVVPGGAARADRAQPRAGRSCAWSADRAAAAVASINESLDHLSPWMAWASRAGDRGRAGRVLRRRRGAVGPAAATSATRSSRGPTSASSAAAGCTAGSTSTASRSATGSTSTASGRASPPRRAERSPTPRSPSRASSGCGSSATSSNVRSARVPEKLGYTLLRRRASPTTGTCEGRPTQVWDGRAGRLDREAARRPPRSLPRVDDRPIGMFDSGFGGLTVARALIDLLPPSTSCTWATPAATRTGRGPLDEVRGFAEQITDLLVARARREARSSSPATPRRPPASSDLQARVDVPVLGVIEPGVRSLARGHPQRPGRA